jgi:glyoxylase-like metal-dependent hydrolase (beta-lactamase superfamily II)
MHPGGAGASPARSAHYEKAQPASTASEIPVSARVTTPEHLEGCCLKQRTYQIDLRARALRRYWKLLNRELPRIGKTLDDVRALILTHGDTDHIGFAARLSREKGIPAYLHPVDADRARMEVKKPPQQLGSGQGRAAGQLPVVHNP